MEREKIIIDVDTGSDDAVALVSAAPLSLMNILLICWNTLLTAGMFILAKKMAQLKKTIG